MGLDMYLNAKRFLSEYNAEDANIINVVKAEQIKGMGDMQPRYLVCEALYWRKANHIHRWFVNNVQDGADDCGHYYVSRDQLTELRDLCLAVLADKKQAPELLPTQQGFFFGGQDYDEWYFSDCQRTVDGIEKLLATEGLEHWDFEYHSSW